MTTDDAARILAILTTSNEADADKLIAALPADGSPGAAATMDAVLWAFERRLSPSPTPRR